MTRARRLFPAASNGEYGIPADRVPIIDRGRGCEVWDTTGRNFLDMTMAWGAALVGHAREEVVDAAMRKAVDGANFAAISSTLVTLAERLEELSPCTERIRFVASGTEATMLCLRVSRAASGRAKILKFEGAYHGQHPEGVASLVGESYPEMPRSDSAGSGAPWVERDVLVAPYNDLETTRRILDEHHADLAAVIVEPLHRCLKPVAGFLEGLRDATARHGIILIFDEVVTGFRLALGGAQEYYGVIPDLAAYGKALGGGFPIGAYGGRADLMEAVSEHRLPGPNYAWSASTTGGNPVSSAAALATLAVLSEPNRYRDLFERGRRLRADMAAILKGHGVSGSILGDGPLAQVAFSERPITTHRDWRHADKARGRAMMLALLDQGIFLNPMGTKLYLSIAHCDAEIDRFLAAFDQALRTTESS